MNRSDSERVASHLDRHGHTQTFQRKKADLVVVNTCGVRQSAEDRVYGLIPKIKKENSQARIILTGCLSERVDVQQRLKDKVDIWLPIKELPYLQNKLTGENDANRDLDNNEYLRIPPKLSSSFSAFIPVGNGCDNYCAYCVVPYARGREVYRPALEVVKEAERIIDEGYKEVNLIAQNVNSYTSVLVNSENSKKYFSKLRFRVDFADLLEAVSRFKKDFWVRFATSHPKDMSDKLIKVIANNKNICRHIHLAAQAGDDGILKKMNRKYTSKHYKKLIDRVRYYIPGASITTDIIVGFPGETRKQFQNTVHLFREVKFDMAYIAQYSPRPGTAAAKMEDDVSAREKKDREEELMKVLRKTARRNNERYINQEVKVLVGGANKKGEWHGRTDANKNVKINNKGAELQAGKFIDVVIDEVQDFGLSGYIKNP